MSDGEDTSTPNGLHSDLRDVKIEDYAEDTVVLGSARSAEEQHYTLDKKERPQQLSRNASETPRKTSTPLKSPAVKSEQEDVVGGDITLKMEPGAGLKLSRKASQKVIPRPPQLFSHLPDATADATSTFSILKECHYAAKYLGYTEPPLECDCTEEWDASTHSNHACGEESDCINRATKMECASDCGCGAECQNQRFALKRYANVSVIKTEKKGYGLRTDAALEPNDFIFEYIGEVIGEPAFRRRMHHYDDEGIKHFYFMSLTKGEFIDATKKGNLGRFCNHSCNPNCYVDKWVVGDKLRMGIFAERKIQAGEELVFNYNVDRYGADPQPCYCGEPNCVGFIGGKQQTGGATTLSRKLVEALGIEDAEDWESAAPRKPRKRKTEEDDEEYVNNLEPKSLDVAGVQRVIGELPGAKEKWIVVKLLSRLQRMDDERVRLHVVRLHGYRHLNTVMKQFMEDINVALQVCDVLWKLPRLTRNKIQDSGIETTIRKVVGSEDERLKDQATRLLEEWSKLEMGFRIRKMKRDPNAILEEKRVERRDTGRERQRSRSRSRSKSPEALKGPTAPTGPRNNIPQRAPPRPFRPRPPPPTGPLPEGWFEAQAANGSIYYYNRTGATTWQRPTLPSLAAPPPPPPKAVSDQELLNNLISQIVSTKKTAPQLPANNESKPDMDISPQPVRKEEKWKSYPEEKRKKLYENILQPHVSYVMNKYKKYLPKDELKATGKKIAKKLVESDFKRGRVENPTSKLSSSREKQVKEYVKEEFDRAAKKEKERRKKAKAKAEEAKKEIVSNTPTGTPPAAEKDAPKEDADEDMQLSENEVDDDEDGKPSATPADIDQSPSTLKRRLEEVGLTASDLEQTLGKRAKIDGDDLPPPPPPPPPPADAVTDSGIATAEMTPDTDAIAVSNGHWDGTDDMQLDKTLAAISEYSKTMMEQASPMQTATPPTTGSPDGGGQQGESKTG